MTSWEIIIVFGGIPLAIMVLIGLLTLGPTLVRRDRRYRPGQDWNYPPVWWIADQAALDSDQQPGGRANRPRHEPSAARGGWRGDW